MITNTRVLLVVALLGACAVRTDSIKNEAFIANGQWKPFDGPFVWAGIGDCASSRSGGYELWRETNTDVVGPALQRKLDPAFTGDETASHRLSYDACNEFIAWEKTRIKSSVWAPYASALAARGAGGVVILAVSPETVGNTTKLYDSGMAEIGSMDAAGNRMTGHAVFYLNYVARDGTVIARSKVVYDVQTNFEYTQGEIRDDATKIAGMLTKDAPPVRVQM